MEEEIITPKEEVFNYQKLRYILDSDGCICHASFGGLISCDLGECTEYNGDVPDGYETIEEWYEEENDKLNAWKVIEGNLVFDPNKYDILQTKCEKEHEDNRYVCNKEISNLTNLVKSDSAENYLTSTSNLSKVVEVTDSNKFASTIVKLIANETIKNKINIKFTNGNLLPNNASSKTERGISFEVNPDRTINVKGTSISTIEYTIGGTLNNTKPILVLKKGINYYLSSNDYQIKMYNFDGIDREEVYSGTGGVINFDKDKLITHVVLYIPYETTVDTTIKPMLNVGDVAKDYVTHESNETTVYLGENTFYRGDNIKIEECTPILQNEIYISDNLVIGDNFVIGGDLIYLDDVVMPITYLDFTYMYCFENVDIQVTYPNLKRNNDLTGYETPNGGFAIDEEGNMYCNDATIRGGDITLTGNATTPRFRIFGTGTWEDTSLHLFPFVMNIISKSRGRLDLGLEQLSMDNFSGETTEVGINSSHFLGTIHKSTNTNSYIELAVPYYDDSDPSIVVSKDNVYSEIKQNGVWSGGFNNNSQESKKKNITLDDGCLEEILESDIVNYHWNYEKEEDKKHIGLVIADNGGNYKTPDKVTTQDGNSIDLYSMNGMAWKAIQELYKLIQNQQKEIEHLKEQLKEVK